MKIKLPRKNLIRRALVFAGLMAGIFLPALFAQPTEPTVQGRFLLIFDTSSAMKNRAPAVQKALKIMLATSLNGQLHSGDSLGVWTFSQELALGNFPLQTWNADNAAVIASNLTKFVGDQHYAKTARFETLQPLLNQVVQNSERLTVLIFCDGSAKASGTSFDASINQIFAEKSGEQSKARQPFIVLLRSQLGKFTGCAVSFPPAPLNIPEFPPLPAPPPPKVTNPPPVITNVAPPLFIIGTNVSTNPPPPVTNPPPVPPPVVPTPAVKIQPTNMPDAPPTNHVIAKITPPSLTNSSASSPDNSNASGKKSLMVGAGLLGAAIALGMVVWLRSHRKDTSLITRSMNDRR